MTTKGMHAVGQAEVVILLQCLPDEKTIPKDVFTHFVQLYQEALSGESFIRLSILEESSSSVGLNNRTAVRIFALIHLDYKCLQLRLESV